MNETGSSFRCKDVRDGPGEVVDMEKYLLSSIMPSGA